MAKRKLLVVVGAGASIEFGMPSVAECRTIIDAEAQRFFPLVRNPGSNLFAYVEQQVTDYWTKAVPKYLYRAPHFEDVLYVLYALAAAYPRAADTSALGALISPKPLPDINFSGPNPTAVGQNQIRSLASISVDALVADFRGRCKKAKRAKTAEFKRLKALVGALKKQFDIAVVTLNYDDIVYRALPRIETGFDPVTGQFEPQRILARKRWPCMLHLHGSVHFDMRTGTADLHEIFWEPDLSVTFSQNSFGRSTSATLEGAEFPMSAIVAGYGKTTQILRKPFRTYYSELDRLVERCDAVLFAGYGFGDSHLNMAFRDFRDARRRPVAIIGFARDDAMTVGSDMGDQNPTIVTIMHTFNTDYKQMQALGSSGLDTVADLKAAKEFEISADANTPLSFWYNGLLEACDNPSKVLARLT